tara:strand:+ start:88 stop:321 length:234 start_codon:yes stop_codon:yes gene_type:complete
MNAYLHTVLAILPIFIAYWAGHTWGRQAFVENMLSDFLSKLSNDGFIRTEKDKDGELELVPISEIVAKSLRDANNHV